MASGDIPDPTFGLGIDDTSLFVADWLHTPGVLRVNKDDGGVTGLDGCNTVLGIASDATHAFWVTRACDNTTNRRVRGVIKSSGFNGYTDISSAFDASLPVEKRLDGLAGDGLHAIKKTGGLEVWSDATFAGTGVAGLAVRDGYVYAADRPNQTIVRLKTDGTDRRTIASGQQDMNAVAVDACFIYWSVPGGGGSVRRAPR